MKIKFNTKSNTVAVYCILVFAACLFLVALVFKYNTFLYYIHKIIKVLSPIIWGIVFAYILNPFVILCDKPNCFYRNFTYINAGHYYRYCMLYRS